MIKLGNNSIGKIYLGSNSIGKAYLGSNLVFQKGGSGPSPSLPYTPVAYIETDGTAYINTGIKGNAPMSAVFKMTPKVYQSASKYELGCRKDSGDTRFGFIFITQDKEAGFSCANATTSQGIDVSSSVDNETPFEGKTTLKNGQCKLEVKQQGESSFTAITLQTNSAITTNSDIYIFCWNNQGTPSGRLAGARWYSCKLYSDDSFTNLVFDAIPCIYNGEYGMWDMVSDSFFGNAADSGAFSGPSNS